MMKRLFMRSRKGAAFLGAFLFGILVMTMSGVGVSALSAKDVTAPSAILMEPVSGKVLFEKNADEKRPCASITKVMTLLLTMEALEQGKLSLDETLTASEHAASMGGSDIWLKPGEEMTVDDLIKATVIMSANDAAVVLAERISGSEDAFVEQMNRRARELGMTNTTFKNCNGLDEEGHLTTARDVAIMSAELLRHSKILDYTTIWMDTIRGGETQLVNTNKLLKSSTGITGLKTGTTSKAGSCISATAERDGMQLVAVVLGCDTTRHRFADAAALLNYGYGNWAVIVPQTPELPKVPVLNGLEPEVSVEAVLPKSILTEKGVSSELKTEVELPESVEAPVEKGQKLGKVTFLTQDGKPLAEAEIVAGASIEEISYGACLSRLFRCLLTI